MVRREDARGRNEVRLEKRLVSNYPRSLERRATDVAEHAHCKRYDCANTTSILSSNYSRNSFFPINSKSIFVSILRTTICTSFNLAEFTRIILNYVTTIVHVNILHVNH